MGAKLRVPVRLGLVRLAAGANLLAHVHGDCPAAPTPVRLRAHLDRSGQAALIALPLQDTANMADDPMLREMTSDPKFRKVLLTDGKSAVGQAVAKALLDAGADMVWVGVAEPWKQAAGLAALEKLPQVTIVPLDVSDEKSVRDLAGVIGGNVLGTEPAMAIQLGSIIFVVIVIGGLGSLSGALAASLIIGVLDNIANTFSIPFAPFFHLFGITADMGGIWNDLVRITGSSIAPVLPYLLLVVMLIVRPRGLLGKRDV